MLLKLNSFIFYLRIFEKHCNAPFVIYSDYLYINITLLGNEMSQHAPLALFPIEGCLLVLVMLLLLFKDA